MRRKPVAKPEPVKAKPQRDYLREIRNLHTTMGNMKEQINFLLIEGFPIGADFTYRHGDHLRVVDVVDHSPYGRIKVRGVTGNDYWLDYARLL